MDRRHTTLGAFVLGSIGLMVLALVGFGNLHLLSTTRRAFVVFPDSAAGLSVGAPVTFRGVTVGSVRAIHIAYDTTTNEAFIPVEMELVEGRVRLTRDSTSSQPSLSELVAKGLRAELNLQSFVTGQSNVNLDFAPQSPALFHPSMDGGVEIPFRRSAIEKVKQTLTELPLKDIINNADTMMASIRTLSEQLNTDLPPLILSLQKTSDTANATLETTRTSIDEVHRKLDTSLASIDALAQHGTAQLDARSADLHALLQQTDDTMRRANATLADLQGMVSTRSPERAELDAALRDVAASAAALRGFASDVERNPQLLLTGRRP